MLCENWGLADLQFSWAVSPPQIKQYVYLSTDHELRIRDPKRGPLPKELASVHNSMETRLAAMIDEDDEPLEGQEDAYEKLAAEIEELDAQRTINLPKKGAVVAVASNETDGNMHRELRVWVREGRGQEVPKGAGG